MTAATANNNTAIASNHTHNNHTTTTVTPTTTVAAATAYPIGTPDSSEPSGYAPPSATALAGYTQSYVTDFNGAALPSGWYSYNGQPGGDPGALFGTSHAVVGGGLLQLQTSLDPAGSTQWVTGGVCQCGTGQLYGAWFVRSRATSAGATAVELLWPNANVWPPEVDFNETGGSATGTSATVHFGAGNSQDQRGLTIDTLAWHTWGVIWTPSSITYTVDGRVWGTITKAAEIPSIVMHLSLQEQTFCASGWACPSAPQQLNVDWVAEYTAN